MRTLEYHAARGAPAHRGGDARHLRAACRPHGHAEMREELEDLAFRELNPTPTGSSASGSRRWPQAQAAGSREIEQQLAKKLADRGIKAEVYGPAQARLFDLAQDGAQARSASSSCRTFSASASSSATVAECYQALGIVHTTWPVRAGALQGLHLDAEAERLPLDPHHRDRAGQAARRAADPHPRDARRSPNTASPRTPSIKTGSALTRRRSAKLEPTAG